MIDTQNIKAVLFDSGRVLNRPRTGHWFMPPNFFKYVDKNKFEDLNIDLVEKAFNEGDEYFHKHPLILTEIEELEHFIEFYKDVFRVIPRLSQHYKLGVVSDTWPSLERVFKNAGLREYFSTFVMSSTLGVLKPHELMFNTALDGLNIRPEEAIFIDDNIVNVEVAIKLGMQGIVILRGDGLKECTNVICVDDLSELKELLEK
ncbi:HAD family hydrolase [Clostridium sp. FP1]|uniref:HAD family hydrolase n=1 Tax=Clostridium sp. FP1 TaxID=2724076 RepID=UPI0013E91FB1|nr:HAD-IA family hydrolase [Clostridium sp. FP1]MBZ9634116.1 HAD-IA family hydrolase [Clostridium sp. FP1]